MASDTSSAAKMIHTQPPIATYAPPTDSTTALPLVSNAQNVDLPLRVSLSCPNRLCFAHDLWSLHVCRGCKRRRTRHLLPQACTIPVIFPDQHRYCFRRRGQHAILVSLIGLADPGRGYWLTRYDCSQAPTSTAAAAAAVETFTCPAQNGKVVTDLAGVQYVLGCFQDTIGNSFGSQSVSTGFDGCFSYWCDASIPILTKDRADIPKF